MKKRFLLAFLPLLWGASAYAQTSDSFTVKHIDVDGLKRIKLDTLYSYLPLKIGDTITPQKSNQILQSLYQSGFFSNIILTHRGDTLIITVVERPVISSINLHGNKDIKSSVLLKALKGSEIASGFEYNPSTLDEIKNILLQQYFTQGKYGAKVHIDVKHLPRGRVDLNIDISEGSVTKIKKVSVIGNQAFPEKELLGLFKLSPPNLLSFFTHNDRYSREKLTADLDSLRSFYLNHGYLKYRLDSSQVSITPDLSWVYITAHITEGAQYKLNHYQFTGKTILPKSALQAVVTLQVGQPFSRQAVIDSQKAIGLALGDKGYAHADVQVLPTIDEKNKTVAITFHIVPHQRIYINHISFSGNYQTNSDVLRRQVEQVEGALSSSKKINQSVNDLQRLPYITNADVTTSPVAGMPNEENVNYEVKEYPSASFTAGLGFSDVDGLLFNVGLNQKSFLGTGNSLNIAFQRSASVTSYNIDYYNPYYTLWGVGREINLNYSSYHAEEANIANFASNDLGFSVSYSIPISNYLAYQLGYGYNNTLLELGGTPATQLINYIRRFGSHYYQVQLNSGLTYDDYDRAILPTRGSNQSLGLSVSVPISPKSLKVYTLSYDGKYFHPIYKDSWLFTTRGALGYGNGYGEFAGNYPFFRNFYVGGMGSVRGYEGNELGPQDSNNDALGGNILADASVGLVFPNPISQNVRTTWFVDGGNVFDSSGHDPGLKAFSLGHFRYSTGLEVDWVSPMGVKLEFSLAQAFHAGNAATQVFGFNIAAGA